MPIVLNEPLNLLQRLCEELEYSELLDQVAILTDPLEQITIMSGNEYLAFYHGFMV